MYSNLLYRLKALGFYHFMKSYLPLLIFLTICSACQQQRSIEDIFPWTRSGSPEADSLQILIEHASLDSPDFTTLSDRRQPLIARACSIADTHPDDKALQARKLWLEAISHPYMARKEYFDSLDQNSIKIDSIKFPYEYRKLLTLRIAFENDPVNLYRAASENIHFFSQRGAPLDEAHNLIIAGNVMTSLQDVEKAMEFTERAIEIYKRYNFRHGLTIAMNNKVRLTPSPMRDSLYLEMIKDSMLRYDPASHALLLQNAYIKPDSIKLLEEALEIYRTEDVDMANLPIVLALRGRYYAINSNPRTGIRFLTEAIDSTEKYTPNSLQNLALINSFLADAYYFAGEKDSCIEAFSRMREYIRFTEEDKSQAEVYANDARTRIEMAERTVKLEKQREIYTLVIVILCLAILILWLVLIQRKRNTERKYKDILMQERNERNLQSIRAQQKVMEESDILIASIEEKIEEMQNYAKISEESAEILKRILRLHKSNEENRQGFLKVQQELDTRFIKNLRNDFPTLSESQIKLASLIAAGLDSRQIGNILNIEQTSVHKSRYRLRTRLGLSKEQSLEDFLRGYNRPIGE